jgi:hypothetical protein
MGQIGQFDRTPTHPADEALIFTPPGHSQPGQAITLTEDQGVLVSIVVRDRATGKPTFCRLNVVGPDGNYYQPPASHPYTAYSLIGRWPESGAGNREAKAPIRHFGHFFYCAGQVSLRVPKGGIWIEAHKGFDYAPAVREVEITSTTVQPIELELNPALRDVAALWYSGDPHLHFPRMTKNDDRLIFDLLEAEDIRFGPILCYNEPVSSYPGKMQDLAMPQRALGRVSLAQRGDYQLISGQEYRNAVYGHINLFLRDRLVLEGQAFNSDYGPLYGTIGAETRAGGGYAFHAHGGYAQEIWADCIHGATNGVELLQFGIYRGIGLEGWYHLLNCGFHFPAVGACDYPACRKLADCRTYVHIDGPPDMFRWLESAARGASFVTTGPLLFLEVDGHKPGTRLAKSGPGPHRVSVQVRAHSLVAPLTHLQLIVNGQIVATQELQSSGVPGARLELKTNLDLDRSSWIAARAFSTAPSGSPDAESHTNPVYVDLDGQAPFNPASADWLSAKLAAQIQEHAARKFDQRDQVVAYFQAARDRLTAMKAAGGQPVPAGTAP